MTPVACGIPDWIRSTVTTSRGSSRPGRTTRGNSKAATGKTIECTPIVIDGVMYVTTGYLRVVALDAATGKELWQFDPLKDHPFPHRPASGGVNRGCAYWSDGKPDGERRIIHGTSDGRLFSLDAKTGKLDPKFGDGGVRNLRKELDPKVAALDYGPTSAPADLEGHDRRRRLVRRRARHRRAGGHPGVRRPHGRAGLAVPDRTPSGRVRTRDVGRRFLEGPRRGERLGRVQHRRGSRPGLRRTRDRRPSTSTAATGTATICSRIARSRSTPGRASASGTFRRCITTCGTTTCRSIPTWSRSRATASRSTPSRR